MSNKENLKRWTAAATGGSPAEKPKLADMPIPKGVEPLVLDKKPEAIKSLADLDILKKIDSKDVQKTDTKFDPSDVETYQRMKKNIESAHPKDLEKMTQAVNWVAKFEEESGVASIEELNEKMGIVSGSNQTDETTLSPREKLERKVAQLASDSVEITESLTQEAKDMVEKMQAKIQEGERLKSAREMDDERNKFSSTKEAIDEMSKDIGWEQEIIAVENEKNKNAEDQLSDTRTLRKESPKSTSAGERGLMYSGETNSFMDNGESVPVVVDDGMSIPDMNNLDKVPLKGYSDSETFDAEEYFFPKGDNMSFVKPDKDGLYKEENSKKLHGAAKDAVVMHGESKERMDKINKTIHEEYSTKNIEDLRKKTLNIEDLRTEGEKNILELSPDMEIDEAGKSTFKKDESWIREEKQNKFNVLSQEAREKGWGADKFDSKIAALDLWEKNQKDEIIKRRESEIYQMDLSDNYRKYSEAKKAFDSARDLEIKDQSNSLLKRGLKLVGKVSSDDSFKMSPETKALEQEKNKLFAERRALRLGQMLSFTSDPRLNANNTEVRERIINSGMLHIKDGARKSQEKARASQGVERATNLEKFTQWHSRIPKKAKLGLGIVVGSGIGVVSGLGVPAAAGIVAYRMARGMALGGLAVGGVSLVENIFKKNVTGSSQEEIEVLDILKDQEKITQIQKQEFARLNKIEKIAMNAKMFAGISAAIAGARQDPTQIETKIATGDFSTGIADITTNIKSWFGFGLGETPLAAVTSNSEGFGARNDINPRELSNNNTPSFHPDLEGLESQEKIQMKPELTDGLAGSVTSEVPPSSIKDFEISINETKSLGGIEMAKLLRAQLAEQYGIEIGNGQNIQVPANAPELVKELLSDNLVKTSEKLGFFNSQHPEAESFRFDKNSRIFMQDGKLFLENGEGAEALTEIQDGKVSFTKKGIGPDMFDSNPQPQAQPMEYQNLNVLDRAAPVYGNFQVPADTENYYQDGDTKEFFRYSDRGGPAGNLTSVQGGAEIVNNSEFLVPAQEDIDKGYAFYNENDGRHYYYNHADYPNGNPFGMELLVAQQTSISTPAEIVNAPEVESMVETQTNSGVEDRTRFDTLPEHLRGPAVMLDSFSDDIKLLDPNDLNNVLDSKIFGKVDVVKSPTQTLFNFKMNPDSENYFSILVGEDNRMYLQEYEIREQDSFKGPVRVGKSLIDEQFDVNQKGRFMGMLSGIAEKYQTRNNS